MSIRRGGFQTRPVLFKMRIAENNPPFNRTGGLSRVSGMKA